MMYRKILFTSLLLALLTSAPIWAQQAVPSDSATVATPTVDSLRAALDRFEVANPPAAADSARLRRWADSVFSEGKSLQRKAPAEARGYFQQALRASQLLADSTGRARSRREIGTTYRLQSRFEEALGQYRGALKISRALGDRAGVGAALMNIGAVYQSQRRNEEALSRLREALQIQRDLGDREEAAKTLSTIGLVREVQSRYEDALARQRAALQIHCDLGNRRDIANARNGIGIILEKQGRYEEALAQYRQALRIERDLGDQRGIAKVLNNIAGVYQRQGRYDEAIGRYRASLRAGRAAGNKRGVTSTLYNIAVIHDQQGQYEEALVQYRKVLQKSRSRGYRRGVVVSLQNIGSIEEKRGQYEKALAKYQDVLEMKKAAGNRQGVANVLSGIGDVHQNQGQYEKALERYREALRISREIGDRPGIARVLNEIGRVHEAWGQYAEALARYREALRLNRQIGDRSSEAYNLDHIGVVHLRNGRLQAATDTLGRAIRLTEQLRTNATSPEARRSWLTKQVSDYWALTTAHVRSGEPDSALRSVERARARLLADRLAGTARADTALSIPSVDELRRALGRDEAALLYVNADTKWPLSVLVLTRDSTYARELPDSTIQADIAEAHPVELNQLRRQKGPLATALYANRPSEDETGPSLAEAIRLYRHHLGRSQSDASVRRDLARRFHRLLIAPVEEHVADTEKLTVVPTGALGYLPFETLRDERGRYLVQNKQVRYTQSLTVLRQLQGRNYAPRPRPLLALGGAAYEPTPASDSNALVAEARGGSPRVATRGHAFTLWQTAERRMEQGRSPRPTYQQLGYARWRDLPGTKKEAERLGTIAGPNATVVTGRGASEDTVRSINRSSRLASYRRIHFATHGVAVTETPGLSALVLSQTGASDSLAARDGYLTMGEIANLDLRADVAVLSACQTGLGRIVAGEGVVSLSHAFLRAGANATLVSQWKVLDKSTRQFMTAVYRRAKGEETSFAEAVTETKRAFVAGEHGEKNTDPLRWAPFVYYGQE